MVGMQEVIWKFLRCANYRVLITANYEVGSTNSSCQL